MKGGKEENVSVLPRLVIDDVYFKCTGSNENMLFSYIILPI
jgi:hypothetical protein